MNADAPTAPPAVTCTGLTRDFGQGHGLFDLDLTVPRGGVFGFLGPNGAGKTTVIRLLMGLLRPDRGSATVLGLEVGREPRAVARRVGYLPGELARFPGLTAGGVLALLGGLRGGVDAAAVAELSARLRLDLRQRYEGLSHGNKQKVGLIQAFMHRPELLILDEPTLGLDPLMQREFRALVKEAVHRGATVFLSSHVLSEVELLCDAVALIDAGRLVRVGTLDSLRASRLHRFEARLARPLAEGALREVPGVSDVTTEDRLVRCAVRGPVGPLLSALSPAGIEELDSRELSLEELFFTALGDVDARR
ncbi:MAG: ABC transporter ATP-binding protein [Myxococcaceae bacterium]|jgi:ABC-2 type transport system ATP-binding protein|nr:ABC transporter ATP-binding protein [Myxococcaceae bacterium]